MTDSRYIHMCLYVLYIYTVVYAGAMSMTQTLTETLHIEKKENMSKIK